MRSEEDEIMLKKAMMAVFNYSNEETFIDAGRNTISEGDLCFGSNSFVSFVRGVEYKDPITNNENHSTPIKPLENGTLSFAEGTGSFMENQSLQKSDIISDAEFADSDKRKELILGQTALGTSLQQGTDCTGCSKWTLISRKNITSVSLDVTKFNQQRRVSIGEFIGAFSESFSSQKQHQPFASTPIQRRKSQSMSSLMDVDRNGLNCTSSVSGVYSSQKDSSSIYLHEPLPLKLSTPKWRNDNNSACGFHYYIGSTARKNIERLRKEERNLRHRDEATIPFSMNRTEDNTVVGQSNNFSNDTRSTIALPCSSLATSTVDQWFIEPQSVILDPNKGNRVRLINNSTKNLKYRTVYDSRTTNICPLSGTIPAMNEIGLRILISQYAKKEYESFETNVNIIVGKSEKSIRVKYTKEEKPKKRRKRSFILH